MHITHVCQLLGLTAFVFQSSASKVAVIWVWPPGTKVYLGESVVLQCSVPMAAVTAMVTRAQQRRWSYSWFRHRPHQALPSLDPPRHLASRDTFAITGVTAEDGGSYWCQAEGPGPGANGSTVLVLSERVQLTVSGIPPPLLSVTPSSLQFFRGDNFTVQCPGSANNPTAWRLRQFSQDFGVKTWGLQAGLCSPLGGNISVEHCNACHFPELSSGNSGLYWCESDTWRSNAVPITVITSNSTRTNWTEVSTHGIWKWSMASCVAVALLSSIVLIVWLIHHRRGKRSRRDCCWPSSKAWVANVDVPKTKQDVTEVQWDLSWMEMSNLLGKQ